MPVRNLFSITVIAGAVIGVAVAHSAGQSSAVSVDSTKVVARVITAPLEAQTLVSDLIGATAYGRDGIELGSVRDLVLGQSGQIAGMVVGVGGFLGVGGKELAVPFAQAEIVKNRDGSMGGVRIELSRAEAEAAPPFRAEADARPRADDMSASAHAARIEGAM